MGKFVLRFAAVCCAGASLTVFTLTANSAEPKVSQLRVAPDKIGPDWVAAPGVVVDDLEAPPAEKATADLIAGLKKQVRPLGVRGLADFTYRQKNDRNRQVTVRAFTFDTAEECQAWIKTKYQFAGWEEKYKRVEDKEHTIFDSLEMRKRIVASGKTLITVGTIADEDDHLPVAKLILEKLKAESKPPAEQPAVKQSEQSAIR